MSCTKIVVHGVSQEVRNRIGLESSDVVLDLPVGFSLRQSKSVEALTDLNKIETEGILDFDLPFSQTNDAVFADYQSPATLDKGGKEYAISVFVSGHAIRFDRLLVLGKSNDWQCRILRPKDHWLDLANSFKISDLDFGAYPIGYPEISGSWNNPVYTGDFLNPNDIDIDKRPVYFPLVDYGGWCDQSEAPQGSTDVRAKCVAVEDFRPFVSAYFVLKAGFCHIGWSLEGLVFETEWFKRLWCYLLRPDYYRASKGGGFIIGRRFTRKHWQSSLTDGLTTDEVIDYDFDFVLSGGILQYFAGVKNITGAALKWRFQMQGDFTNDRSDPFTYVFGVWEMDGPQSSPSFTGELLSTETLIVEFAGHETKTILFDQIVILKPGQLGAISCSLVPTVGAFYIESGLHIRVTPANDSLMSGDTINVRDCIKDYKLLDVFKGIIHILNGKIETDFDTKTVTVRPNKTSSVYGEKVPGFLMESEAGVDISGKMILGSVQVKQVKPDLKRFTRFEFAKSGDAYISSLNLSQPAHSRTINNGEKYPNEVQSFENPFFEPTLEGWPPANIASGAGSRNPPPFLPRIWDNTNGQRSFNVGPRILFAYGNIQQINPNPIGSISEFTTYFFDHPPNPADTGLEQTFGYVSQLPTWEMTPAPAQKWSVVYGTYEQDLFMSFYLGITRLLRDGALIDLLMLVRMSDYLGFDFRRMYSFPIGGVPMRVPMTAVRDFAGCSDEPTPITFFAEPSETTCCDLPCGCQFISCDYYQDFGLYMRQATMDDLLLTSFKIDGIEFLGSPVAFGKINIVEIGGKRYITNMIDVLNSVGAPYFSFSISLREHPQKGRRFFSLKRLACITFEIIIESSGVPVYRYRHDEQKTAWFTPGVWNNFGYGAQFFGTPIDCVTTTEY